MADQYIYIYILLCHTVVHAGGVRLGGAWPAWLLGAPRVLVAVVALLVLGVVVVVVRCSHVMSPVTTGPRVPCSS